MIRTTLQILAIMAVACSSIAPAADAPRTRTLLDDNWKFQLGDPASAQANEFDDTAWRGVTLPHDWSIEGKSDPKAPMGGGGGFFPSGIGWYRLHLNAPADWKDRRVVVEFEGIYMNADVWMNGQHLATQPYGYTSFNVDLTAALKPGADNVLAVRVDNSQPKNSRWYGGSGIYRHVWLTVTNPVHVAPWGVFVSVPQASADEATVAVQTRMANDGSSPESVTVQTVLLAPDGTAVGKMESTSSVAPGGRQDVSQQTKLTHPALWMPETPQLSHAVTHLLVNGQEVDQVTTTYGVRALAWTADKGLTINGTTYKMKGGCFHGDNGVLGVCAFDRAEERKVEFIKAAGFTAIRTAHNPPSPAFLDDCDRLGMLVLDEAFDCWNDGKLKYDYSYYFANWWKSDIDAMVLRDRNHPSVVMWSTGNEIPGIYSSPKVIASGPLIVDEFHALDSTRPVTTGVQRWPTLANKPRSDDAERYKNAEFAWSYQDIVGDNYELGQHVAMHDKYPNRVLISTESNTPLGLYKYVLADSFVVGDFVWSGQDYLGEVGVGRWFYVGDPTEPFDIPNYPNAKPEYVGHGNDRLYPWRGATCGLLDLLGNPKPAMGYWNIAWQTGPKLSMGVRQPQDDTHKLLFMGWGWYPTWESWTWPGWEGKSMEVEVYSSYDKVRLYLDDKLMGEQPAGAAHNYFTIFKLPYEPGTLKAVGLQDGAETTDGVKIATVGDAAAVRLTPDRATIKADAQDLSFINVEVVDKDGNVQPNADQLVLFKLTGPGTIAGLGNANLKSEEPYQGTECHVFHGRALIVLRSSKQAGALALSATATGLTGAATTITAQ